MKKLFCILLTVLFCLGICGCHWNKLPHLSSKQAETIELERSEQLVGDVVKIVSDNVLVMGLEAPYEIEKWGEKVYVITDNTEQFCIGDEIYIEYVKYQKPFDSDKYVRIYAQEVDHLSYVAKPIIYFYPQMPTVCSAKVTLNGQLTCTYPKHGNDGWQNFTANPDGSLVFQDGRQYYALYWEGIQKTEWDFSRGWCVRGEDTADFLEWALAKQGLNEREANEFIVYWLPLMQNNPYNVISFQKETYTDSAVLDVEPDPDNLLRVFMAYYGTDSKVDIQPQTFDEFSRQGFTVVEWGGTYVNKP